MSDREPATQCIFVCFTIWPTSSVPLKCEILVNLTLWRTKVVMKVITLTRPDGSVHLTGVKIG